MYWKNISMVAEVTAAKAHGSEDAVLQDGSERRACNSRRFQFPSPRAPPRNHILSEAVMNSETPAETEDQRVE